MRLLYLLHCYCYDSSPSASFPSDRVREGTGGDFIRRDWKKDLTDTCSLTRSKERSSEPRGRKENRVTEVEACVGDIWSKSFALSFIEFFDSRDGSHSVQGEEQGPMLVVGVHVGCSHGKFVSRLSAAGFFWEYP